LDTSPGGIDSGTFLWVVVHKLVSASTWDCPDDNNDDGNNNNDDDDGDDGDDGTVVPMPTEAVVVAVTALSSLSLKDTVLKLLVSIFAIKQIQST
jgi:hypothetical protein